jgi:hypothetical protein
LFEPDLSLIPPEFGMSSAGGVDIDGDGFSDVIVGAPRCADPNCETAGRVYVFPGSRSGTSAKPMVTWFDATTGGPPTDFGRHLLALGDVDGDGFDDLLINPTGTNTAYSFAGGPKPGSGPTETLAAPDDVASPGASFAFIASPGDIDGDSRADAVAASVAGLVTSATPSGTVLEYSGSGSGLVRALPFARPYPSCP